MTLPNITDEIIEDIAYHLFLPLISIKRILNNFLCEFMKKK
jgi:hypothetical protein